MIKIEATKQGNQTALRISLRGTGEDIVQQAVHIMMQLPLQIRETDEDAFKAFVDLYGDAIAKEGDKYVSRMDN